MRVLLLGLAKSIYYKIVVTHQAEKNWMYDRTTVQGATFNMRGQLWSWGRQYQALFSSPVVSALGSESDDPGSSPGRGKALCPWDVQEKCELRFSAWLNLYIMLESLLVVVHGSAGHVCLPIWLWELWV